MIATPNVVRVTPTRACDPSPLTIPTSSKSSIQGNDKGTDLLPSHEIDVNIDLTTPCDDINDLSVVEITPSIIKNCVADLSLPCDRATAIVSEFVAPCVDIIGHENLDNLSDNCAILFADLVTPPIN
jgi:hypothetical protein